MRKWAGANVELEEYCASVVGDVRGNDSTGSGINAERPPGEA
jgi:hypothetical protein